MFHAQETTTKPVNVGQFCFHSERQTYTGGQLTETMWHYEILTVQLSSAQMQTWACRDIWLI